MGLFEKKPLFTSEEVTIEPMMIEVDEMVQVSDFDLTGMAWELYISGASGGVNVAPFWAFEKAEQFAREVIRRNETARRDSQTTESR